MRGVNGMAVGIALLAGLVTACGSTGGDRLVLSFAGFDSVNLTQEDSVGPTSADVDAVEDICVDMSGNPVRDEPFTEAKINANFVNNEGSDITLQHYVVHFDDPNSGLADLSGNLGVLLLGGRCSITTGGSSTGGTSPACTSDSDCGPTAMFGSCAHTETAATGLVLADFDTKLHVNPAIFGQSTPVTITFFGSDPNGPVDVTTHYNITFADFDHCTATTGGQ